MITCCCSKVPAVYWILVKALIGQNIDCWQAWLLFKDLFWKSSQGFAEGFVKIAQLKGEQKLYLGLIWDDSPTRLWCSWHIPLLPSFTFGLPTYLALYAVLFNIFCVKLNLATRLWLSKCTKVICLLGLLLYVLLLWLPFMTLVHLFLMYVISSHNRNVWRDKKCEIYHESGYLLSLNSYNTGSCCHFHMRSIYIPLRPSAACDIPLTG